MLKFRIGNRIIGRNKKPFIIAELSANHGNSIKNCLKLVKLAKQAGADAIKLQTYKPDTITINSKKYDFRIRTNSPWNKYKTIWDLYSKSFTPWSWHKKIFEEAKKHNLEYFSSPFDETSVDFLNQLKVKAYKIASSEINHLPMIEKIVKLNKPIIISLGFANTDDLKNLKKLFKKYNFKKFIFLNCVSKYPAKFEDYSFNDHNKLSKKFLVGLSDHTTDNRASITSLINGGVVFEKHIKLYKLKSIDSFFSSDYVHFKKYVEDIRLFHKVISNQSSNLKKHKNSTNKRSIYVTNNIKKGDKFDTNNIKIIRPGKSIHPKYIKKIIGHRSKKNLSVGSRINIKDVK